MPIDVRHVRSAELPETTAAWSADDVILYHLGLGAGDPPDDECELAYVYERGLKVLPAYGVLPAMPSLFELLSLPGMDVDMRNLLHAEQDVELHEPLPVAGSVRTSARVAEIYDKGTAALLVLETVSRHAADLRPLATNRFSAFFRGEGGFGGSPGPAPEDTPPERAPDEVAVVRLLPQQALIYRLSGDKNPLHADPAFARKAGFERPIVHGLCSFGVACKAVVDAMLVGDVTRVAGYRARFAGVVFPGETLEVSMWREDARVLLAASCRERSAPVLSNGIVRLTGDRDG